MTDPQNIKNQKGFMLPEILLVVAVVSILAGIAIIVVGSKKHLGDTHNIQRQADITAILNAIHQYSLANETIPPAISTTATEICATGARSCAGLIDLSATLVNTKYMASIPKDPQCSSTCTTNGTGYKISKDANDHVTVAAPAAENSKTISITR